MQIVQDCSFLEAWGGGDFDGDKIVISAYKIFNVL